MYRATDYYDDTLATIAQYLATIDNDKSNCLAPLFARSLDCMAGIHSELEPEVKISLTESWIVASHHPGDGAFACAFVTEFGCVCYQDTYPMYPDVSCMYLACILMCPVHIHQDTCKIRDTSRYMQDTSRYNIKIHLYLICHFGYHRKCILPRRRLQISYRSPRSGCRNYSRTSSKNSTKTKNYRPR